MWSSSLPGRATSVGEPGFRRLRRHRPACAVAREVTEQDMDHQAVTERELRRMIRSGEIVDGASLAAYCLLLIERDSARMRRRVLVSRTADA